MLLTPVALVPLALVVALVAYTTILWLLGRRTPPRVAPTGDGRRPTLVFLIPCLNEGVVIGRSLDRLLEMPGTEDAHIVVIDDGSDDNTADEVRARRDPRVHLFQRAAPNARQGKGEALNAAYRHILAGHVVPVDDPQDIVIGVIDADGRLDPRTLADVMPLFAHDPATGGVQIGVRINNRTDNWLARMQDIEFVLYTEVFQRGRRHLGSVGLGGNGQFVRLSALESLGLAPWSKSLTEDLDLGVRLRGEGWKLDFCHTASVNQQGLVSTRRWIKQRTRWFQGHLQSWPLVPHLRRRLPLASRADLLYHLTSPFLLLVGSILSLGFGLWLASTVTATAFLHRGLGWWLLSSYLFSYGFTALLGAAVYLPRERGRIGLLKTIGLMHTYVWYSMLWYLSGWKAAWRALVGKNNWVKTDRVAEAPEEDTTPAITVGPRPEPAAPQTAPEPALVPRRGV